MGTKSADANAVGAFDYKLVLIVKLKV
jgi:hypothetical protein